MIEALRQAGAPQEVIDRASTVAQPDAFEVWPENWDSVMAFLDLRTSWDWISPGMSAPVRVGIRASEIEAALRLAGVKAKRRRKLYDDIRTMEGAALEVLQ